MFMKGISAIIKWQSKLIKYFIYSVSLIAFFYGVWLICRVFMFEQFIIPSDSMRPTLIPGDRVIVDKTLMGLEYIVTSI